MEQIYLSLTYDDGEELSMTVYCGLRRARLLADYLIKDPECVAVNGYDGPAMGKLLLALED